MHGEIDLLIHPEVKSDLPRIKGQELFPGSPHCCAKNFGFRAISAVKTTQKVCSTASTFPVDLIAFISPSQVPDICWGILAAHGEESTPSVQCLWKININLRGIAMFTSV